MLVHVLFHTGDGGFEVIDHYKPILSIATRHCPLPCASLRSTGLDKTFLPLQFDDYLTSSELSVCAAAGDQYKVGADNTG